MSLYNTRVNRRPLGAGQSDPWKKSMSVFKKAGVVVTSPSSGTYVVEEIGNVGVLADLLDECLAARG